jgi:EAL domain-containing protein (putative c-di-GMP-specific phosphodiesterase class I)
LSRSIALAHILRQPDGSSTGIWGTHVLRSAFQPIFAFRAGKLELAAFEGLIRPERDGMPVSPGAFFPKIPPIDRLHVETLARNLHLLNAGAFLDPATRIFINFDPSVFDEPAIADAALRDMRLVLHEARIDPRRLVCEVTEQKSSSPSGLARFVDALRAHGFRIAVDDYGAEDSDMARVAALKPDIVKFDAQWITSLMASGPGAALLKVMVTQFSDSGALTVFEGIEEGWQLELAESCGAAMVQGYVLARPQTVPAVFSRFAGEGRTGGPDDRPRQVAHAPALAAATKNPARQPFGKRRA